MHILYTLGFMKRVCSAYTFYIFTIYLSLCTQSDNRERFSRNQLHKKTHVFISFHYKNKIYLLLIVYYFTHIFQAPTYVVRKFDISKQGFNKNRVIVHIQYTQWPDRYSRALTLSVKLLWYISLYTQGFNAVIVYSLHNL